MHLPVIIVSYNTRELLRGCLSSLRQSKGAELDIVVVDNASPDGSADMVRAEFPHVRLLAQTQNLGFAAANNAALVELGFGVNQPKLSTLNPNYQLPITHPPDYVLFLNPDSTVRSNAVATLVDFMRTQPRAGLVGAQLVYPDGRFQHSAFRFPGLAQTFLDFFPLHHRLLSSWVNGRYPRSTQPFEIDHPLGACMVVRREVIQQVGLLDEGYFMYVEEVDWCRRIKAMGWQVWCEPRALVVHHEGQATKQFRHAMFVALWRSRLRYFRKYHSAAYVALVRLIIRLGFANLLRHTPVIERAERLAAFAEVMSNW
jgi:GT2 family glycosyltransferase